MSFHRHRASAHVFLRVPSKPLWLYVCCSPSEVLFSFSFFLHMYIAWAVQFSWTRAVGINGTPCQEQTHKPTWASNSWFCWPICCACLSLSWQVWEVAVEVKLTASRAPVNAWGCLCWPICCALSLSWQVWEVAVECEAQGLAELQWMHGVVF